jgi:uncharacterized protein (DUF433 family)
MWVRVPHPINGEYMKGYPLLNKVEGVCGKEPCVKGTRLSVRFIANYVFGQVFEQYPLSKDQIMQCVEYYLNHKKEMEEYKRLEDEEFLNMGYEKN